MAIVRWLLLANGVLALLGATVLYGPARRRVLDPWLRLNERVAGRPLDPPMFRERPVRLWWLLMGALMLAAWWYLGTPDGATAAARLLAPRR
jgi:hypothetical protein